MSTIDGCQNLLQVFDYLPLSDQCSLSATCKKMREIFQSSTNIKPLLTKKFGITLPPDDKHDLFQLFISCCRRSNEKLFIYDVEKNVSDYKVVNETLYILRTVNSTDLFWPRLRQFCRYPSFDEPFGLPDISIDNFYMNPKGSIYFYKGAG